MTKYALLNGMGGRGGLVGVRKKELSTVRIIFSVNLASESLQLDRSVNLRRYMDDKSISIPYL